MKTIGVVGAGLMGREIALVFALAERAVTLVDTQQSALTAAQEKLAATVDKGIARGILQPTARAALDRIKPTLDNAALSDCHLVVEAVFEDEAVKAGVLGNLDKVCKQDCVIATNTSTIPISTLAQYVCEERKARFLGTHFFSPAKEAGKTPIRVRDVTGFAVNRVLHAFVIEAIRLVEEGVATPEDIDVACKLGLGHPIGPFELMDLTSSSLCLQVQEILQEAYGERFRPRPLLKQRVRAGLVGGPRAPGWLKRDR